MGACGCSCSAWPLLNPGTRSAIVLLYHPNVLTSDNFIPEVHSPPLPLGKFHV